MLACLLGADILFIGMLLGATASTQGPLSCFDSGRVHPNLFFQQAYAFTVEQTCGIDIRTLQQTRAKAAPHVFRLPIVQKNLL
jgi:hypothetical protein